MLKKIYLSFLLFSTHILLAQSDLSKWTYEELDSVINIQYDNGTIENLLPYALAGKDKYWAEYQKKDSIYSQYLSSVAYYFEYMGQFEEAEKGFLEVIKIRKEVLGENHYHYSGALNDLAALYYRMGRYEEAETFYLRTIAIDKKILGSDNPEFGISLNNLAVLYESMGRYEEAEPLHLQTMEIYKKAYGEKDLNYAITLGNLGQLYRQMRHYEQAEPLLVQALEINKQALGEEHPNYNLSLNNLAVLYHYMERNEQAEPLFLYALNLRKKLTGENTPEYAQALNNLAAVYKALGKNKEAEPLYLQALKIRKLLLGTNHPDYAQSLNNLAILYKALGKNAESERFYIEATEIYKQNLGEKHQNYSHALNNLATFYLESRKNELCWKYIRLALKSSTDFDGTANVQSIDKVWSDSIFQAYSSNQQLNNIITSLQLVFTLTEGIKDKQLIICDLAAKLLKKARNSYADDKDKLRILALSNDWMLKTLDVLEKNQFDKAFELAEQNKSVLLLDAAKTEQAHSFGDLPDSLVRQEKQLQKTLTNLQAALLENRSSHEKDSLRSALNHLNIRIKNFKTAIEKKYAKYAALKYKQEDIGTASVQALLADETAIFEFVVSDSSVHILFIDKQKTIWSELKISKEILHQNIQKLHTALSDYKLIGNNPKKSYNDYTNTAYWFYQNLLANAIKNTTAKNLIIIPDGELGHLPFETFLTKPASQEEDSYNSLAYLVNDFAISYNYSATLWKENIAQGKLRKNNGKILAMAADYEKVKTLQSEKQKFTRSAYHQHLRSTLQALPAANQEVKTLSEQFDGLFAFGLQATEKEFKQKAGEYGIIHLAMHGLLDKESPILSNLAFTEDGDSLENNFLQAFEISKMELNADLVVLSACETGYGKFEKGNGLASLARAFMYAGVPAMVVSLWEVNDYSTSEIMKIFYAHLANGLDKAAALRQAKLDYIKKAEGLAAHPAFWSPFIQLGDSRAILVETRGMSKVWWAGMGIGCILLLWIGYKKRK